nr:integrase, catalytic region, zinc finger, CCHC-type, peptidase aspartic, catalytic [Tanacetum cinerariifolium]
MAENILKSIDEYPFKMEKFRETLAEGIEGALHLGLERDKVFAYLTPKEKERYKANIRATNILLQGLPKDIYTLINHYTDAKDIWDNVKILLEGGQTNTFDDDVDEAPVQDLALNEDNVFQDDQCYAFDSDVDEAHTVQTMFMANLSSTDPIYDEAGLSYDSDILSEATQCVSVNEQNKVVNVSLTAELVEVYEKKARLMKEEVATLKKDFKQKENKYLEEFLDMKELKEKKKVAIGYKNPLYRTTAMEVQSALYNSHEIVKTNHAPDVVLDSEDTLKIDEITRKRMLEKVKSPLYSDCSKHMMGNRSRLNNFMKRFIGIAIFGNGHFGAIMGYGDYVIGDSVIFRVYYVEGLGCNLFSVADTPSSTTIDQDAPFTNHSMSSLEVKPPISHQGVAVGPAFEDYPFAQVEDDPFENVFATKHSSEVSSSGDVSSAKSNQVIQPHNHLKKWSKDHPMDNVISNPSRLVSIRKQLATNAL